MSFLVSTAALALWGGTGPDQAQSLDLRPPWGHALDSVPAFLQLHLSAPQTLIDASGKELKSIAHILTGPGGHLHVGHSQLPGQHLSLLPGDQPSFSFVTLVAHQDEQNLVRVHVITHLTVPLFDVLKGDSVGHVKHQQAAGRVAIVGPGH